MGFKRTIHAVDTHAGTPMRVITGGVPHIPGNSVYEKMKWLESNDDQLRKLMLREPRGYPAHCCNIIVPPLIRRPMPAMSSWSSSNIR